MGVNCLKRIRNLIADCCNAENDLYFRAKKYLKLYQLTVHLSGEDHHIIAKFHGDVYSCLKNWAPITRKDIEASILRCSLKIPSGGYSQS